MFAARSGTDSERVERTALIRTVSSAGPVTWVESDRNQKGKVLFKAQGFPESSLFLLSKEINTGFLTFSILRWENMLKNSNFKLRRTFINDCKKKQAHI